MAETLSLVPELYKNESPVARLRRISRNALRRYFGLGIRDEKEEGVPFEVYGYLPPDLLGNITSKINSHLQAGGDVVILSFADTEKDVLRSQVFSTNTYMRQIGVVDFHGHDIEEKRKGNFSISMFTPRDKKVRGALGLDVKDAFGTEKVFTVSWNDPDNLTKRYAILTHMKGKWEVILDFRLDQDGKVPAWKVNKSMEYRQPFYKRG